MGAGCLVSNGSLAIPDIAGVRNKNEHPRVFYKAARPHDSKTNQMLLAYPYISGSTAALLYCCSGWVGGWCVGGGCMAD